MRPPTVDDAYLPDKIIVYVPEEYFTIYKAHDFWGLFDVRSIGAVATETEDVKVTPTETTADVAWPVVTNAATYELVINDKSGNTICTLVFNDKGQLTSIAFNAPARDNAPQQTEVAGFSFTVTGLEQGTTYSYTLTAKDSGGNAIDTKTGSFTTEGATALKDATEDNRTQSTTLKVLDNGILYILLPDGTRYDARGTMVK